MKTFYRLLGSVLLTGTTNNFVWFALTFWIYLTTRSVISTGLTGGLFVALNALSSFWLGSLVDHHKKKTVMMGSSVVSLACFTTGYLVYTGLPPSVFESITSPYLWLFSGLLLIGTIAGSVYQIAVPTLVTILVPTEIRDKANGMLGTVMGVGFAITSVASGFTLAYGGMEWVLVLASLFTAVAIGYLMTIPIPENEETPGDGEKEEKKIDLTGTIKAIRKVPGLFALIFFTTFNNLVGGVFMALMDAYGLSLVSVQAWGTLWGLLSFGFILGGLAIAKWGLGTNPLRTLFRVNSLIWVTCILFPLQPSIVLVAMGAFVWMSMFPYIEATEQTIIQKVVPAARQGRVFGFAHSVEQAATPLTAFLIGPITQLFFIPLMTTGIGARLIGGWFGTGEGRGIAVVFILAGVIGLLVTSVAQRSSAYAKLAVRYRE